MATFTSSLIAATPVALASAASLSSSSVRGAGFVSVASAGPKAPISRSRAAISCGIVENEDAPVSRRSALSLLAGAVSVGALSGASPALAAYGEAANIFGSPKPDTGFKTYAGEGFSLSLPAKWNPSKEVEFPGQVIRYEDNFDQLSNLSVSILPSEKKSITDYGSPESFLKSVSYLLGKQSYKGETLSEGGFDPNAVATASIFKAEVAPVNGKPYYYLAVLTRTGDGTEGGRHQYIVATIDAGKLFIFKAQAGDKRWFKGTQKFVEGAASSFTVA